MIQSTVKILQSPARVLSLVILSQKNLVKALYSDPRKAIK